MWSFSGNSRDFTLSKKIREDHCLVGCSTLKSGREAPLQMNPFPSSSALMEAKVSVKCWCCSTRQHCVTYKKTVMLMITSHLTRCKKFPSMITSSTKYSNKGAVSLIVAERSLSELGFVRGQKLQSAEYETLLQMGLQC